MILFIYLIANTHTPCPFLIFANWRAWPALFACLLFGFLQATGNYLQGFQIGGFQIPVQFINMLPYVMTVVLLAGCPSRNTSIRRRW